jgi:hemerythrin-like domain-containing protein
MDTPDLTIYRGVHTALRDAASRLAETARGLDPTDDKRSAALARYWKGLVGEITEHHTLEDDFFFPALLEKVPAVASTLAVAAREHHELDAILAEGGAAVAALPVGRDEAARARFAAAMRALDDHVTDHLDLEDADLLPMFERHFTVAEYEALEQAALKAQRIGAQVFFTVPFVLDASPAEVRAHMLDTAPAMFRVLYVLSRRHFARLERTALGVPTAAPLPI